jgi:hypothetical protein
MRSNDHAPLTIGAGLPGKHPPFSGHRPAPQQFRPREEIQRAPVHSEMSCGGGERESDVLDTCPTGDLIVAARLPVPMCKRLHNQDRPAAIASRPERTSWMIVGGGVVTHPSQGFTNVPRHIPHLAFRGSSSGVDVVPRDRRYATPRRHQPAADVDPIWREDLDGRAGPARPSQRILTPGTRGFEGGQ